MPAGINFKKSQNGLNDHNGLENMNYTIVKYRDAFYCPHTQALTPVIVKIDSKTVITIIASLIWFLLTLCTVYLYFIQGRLEDIFTSRDK